MKARVITETQLWKIERYGWCFFTGKLMLEISWLFWEIIYKAHMDVCVFSKLSNIFCDTSYSIV